MPKQKDQIFYYRFTRSVDISSFRRKTFWFIAWKLTQYQVLTAKHKLCDGAGVVWINVAACKTSNTIHYSKIPTRQSEVEPPAETFNIITA